MAYKIARSFKIEKLISRLNAGEYRTHATEDAVFFADTINCFRVPRLYIEHYRKNLGVYLPPTHDQDYRGKKGKLEIYDGYGMTKTWKEHISKINASVIQPTDHFYQPDEGLLVRKFTNEEHAEWIFRGTIEIFGSLAEDLAECYQFERIYNPSNPKRTYPLRVSFRIAATCEWEPIALLMPFNLPPEKIRY